jgi:hypothetical protein
MRMRCVGHVARLGDWSNVYRFLVRRLEGKKPLEKPRRRRENNIKMDLRDIGIDGRNWIQVAQGTVQ